MAKLFQVMAVTLYLLAVIDDKVALFGDSNRNIVFTGVVLAALLAVLYEVRESKKEALGDG